MVHWSLLEFALDLFPAVPVFSCHDMHSLEYASRPGATLVPVRTIEFRFGIVHVCIYDRTVGAHRDHALFIRFARGDRTGRARANVVVRCGTPLFALFVEPSHENGLFRFFVQLEVALADNRSEDKIVWLAKRLEASEHGRGTDWNSHHRRSIEPVWLVTAKSDTLILQNLSPEGYGELISAIIVLAADRVHQIPNTVGLGIYDLPGVFALEQTVPFCANRVAVQIAKAFPRIAYS